MNKSEVRSIIEATLTSGSKTPGVFELPKMLVLKNKLESCSSTSAVVSLLEENRSSILKVFGIEDSTYQAAIEKIRNLA